MLNNNSLMDEITPLEFLLSQNYPNPFKDKTVIKYCVAYKTRVQIAVYNSEGKEIEKLVDEEKQPGVYEVKFSATTCHSGESRNLPDGYYYYTLKATDYRSERKWLCINNLSGNNTMKTLLQSLFFFLLVTQICFAQWYQQNSGTTKNLNAVTFFDENNGLAVGDSGTALRTNDGGISWTPVVTGIINDFRAMDFINANNGWAVTSAGILYTTDGGKTWVSQLVLPLTNLFDVTFVDASNGWVVGRDSSSFILRTTDGGTIWTQTTIPFFGPNNIFFMDVNNGWIINNDSPYSSSIFKTTDGGNTWVLQIEIGGGSELGTYLNDVVFFDMNIGIAVGSYSDNQLSWQEVIVKTTDGGVNWTQILLGGFRRTLNGVFFTSAMEGIAIGETYSSEGIIYQTTDGGNSWVEQVIGSINALKNVYFVDSVNGWTVGNNGTILHTTNGGVNFIEEKQINEIPTEFLLSNNYPNPFNPSTKINYAVPQTSQVQIKVFDVLGNEIEILVNEDKPAGTYEITWNSANLPSGVYFYRLQAGSFIETKKMILLK